MASETTKLYKQLVNEFDECMHYMNKYGRRSGNATCDMSVTAFGALYGAVLWKMGNESSLGPNRTQQVYLHNLMTISNVFLGPPDVFVYEIDDLCPKAEEMKIEQERQKKVWTERIESYEENGGSVTFPQDFWIYAIRAMIRFTDEKCRGIPISGMNEAIACTISGLNACDSLDRLKAKARDETIAYVKKYKTNRNTGQLID